MTPSSAVQSAARWLERALFVIGGGLALWCVFSVGLTYYYARLPIPLDTGAARLPGDPASASPALPQHEPRSWVARLDAPTVALSATVLEGSDDGTLARAAGHIEATAFPGQPGNVGIAGHRDTIFRPLQHLRPGDPLTLSTSDRVFHYRVSGTHIVEPEDVYVLDPTEQPAVTLVTCYPFEFLGHAPQRFIVRAELVGESARLVSRGPGGPGVPNR